MSVWKPSVTVAAVIECDGKFLFVHERISNGRLVLNQPAGHLDPGESLVAACAREVLEETAHRFAPDALVGVYRWNSFLRFCFRGTVTGTASGPLDKEIVALQWLSARELKERKAEHRSPLVQKCVDDFLAGRSFPLELFSPEFA